MPPVNPAIIASVQAPEFRTPLEHQARAAALRRQFLEQHVASYKLAAAQREQQEIDAMRQVIAESGGVEQALPILKQQFPMQAMQIEKELGALHRANERIVPAGATVLDANNQPVFTGPMRETAAQGFTLAPGARRYDPQGNLVAEAPERAQTAGDVNAGSFEDYVLRYAAEKGKQPNQVTVAEIRQLRKEYQQADDRPIQPRITVNTGGATGGLDPAMPATYRMALGRSILTIPAVRRPAILSLANQLWQAGDEAQLKDVIKQVAIETENVDMKNQVRGRQATLASLADTRAILEQLKKEGVPTNFFTGTVEDLYRKLGTTQNPKYVELANRLQGTLINYRRSATGVQFGERESEQYQKMFPNYKNTLPVNLALIRGLEREMRTYDRTYWEGKLGKSGAELVGAMPSDTTSAAPAAPAGGGAVPTYQEYLQRRGGAR